MTPTSLVTTSRTLALGVALSLAATIATLLFLLLVGRSRPGTDSDAASGSTPPIEPAIDTFMPATLPQHFTEDLILPGLTETGQDVERQDDMFGRSPEGA